MSIKLEKPVQFKKRFLSIVDVSNCQPELLIEKLQFAGA